MLLLSQTPFRFWLACTCQEVPVPSWQMQGKNSVLCALLIKLQHSACNWDAGNVRSQVTPYNQVRPGSVAEWKLVEGEDVGKIKEGWSQQTAQESKGGVSDEYHGLCLANGLAERRGIHRETDDWDHDLTQPHAPTHRQGWVLQQHQQQMLRVWQSRSNSTILDKTAAVLSLMLSLLVRRNPRGKSIHECFSRQPQDTYHALHALQQHRPCMEAAQGNMQKLQLFSHKLLMHALSGVASNPRC